MYQDLYNAPLVKGNEGDGPNTGVQQCSAKFEFMQNVSTLQEFTACCLSRLDGDTQ